MRNKLRFVFVSLLLCVVFSGCVRDDNVRVVLSTGFAPGELFRVGEASCTKQEMNVYLANALNRYGDVFGEDVLDGTDKSEAAALLQDTIRETTLALVSQIKAMTLLAEEIGVSLTTEEREAAAAAAAAYYASLTEDDLAAFDRVSQDRLTKMYEEVVLAERVYAYAIRDVNPEISDDEARTITVELICIHKGSDASSARTRIGEAYERLLAGEDFSSLLSEYNEGETERATFGAGDSGDIPEETAFNLETGETSGILETESAWYILRCVSSFDRTATRANKARIVARRRNEAFGELYDAFVENVPVQLNEDLWSSMGLPFGAETAEFWHYYDVFFGEEQSIFTEGM